MDVSKINAVSPRQIDWRQLTAKEIIKYEREGLEVPSLYLQWAQNFIAEVNSTDRDETTYAMATTKDNLSHSSTTDITGSTGTTNTTDTTDTISTTNTTDTTGSTSTTQNSENDVPLTAEEKRAKMEEEEASLFKMGLTFRADSKEKGDIAENAENVVKSIGEEVANGLSSIDSYMKNLLDEAEEINQKIDDIKNKKTKKLNQLEKMAELQQQLKALGVTGQTVASTYEDGLTVYEQVVDTSRLLGDDAIDYGGVTIDIGEDLKKSGNRPFLLGHKILGYLCEYSGKNAIENAEDLGNSADNTVSVISGARSNISGYTSEIQDKTGVTQEEVNDNTDENNVNNSGNDVNNPKNVETEKDVQTAQNDGSEAAIVASMNIDEILKRKIRRGQNVEQQA